METLVAAILALGMQIYDASKNVDTLVTLNYSEYNLDVNIKGYVDSLTDEEIEHPRYGTFTKSSIKGVNDFLIKILDICDNNPYVEEVHMDFYYDGDNVTIQFKQQ